MLKSQLVVLVVLLSLSYWQSYYRWYSGEEGDTILPETKAACLFGWQWEC